MPAININKYFSQWDDDNGGATGACGETCLKMIDTHLTNREIAISEIIRNGDNNTAITNIQGMKDAASWLGFGVDYYYDVVESDIKKWLAEGKLIVAVIDYSKFPAKYKQDQNYNSGHFILITGVTDDGKAIRFADPNFWGSHRNDGWMDNNKWASYGDFYMAFYHNVGAICRNGSVLVSKVGGKPNINPCEKEKAELKSLLEEERKKTMALVTEKNALKTQVSDTLLELDIANAKSKDLLDQNVVLSEKATKAKADMEIAEQRYAVAEKHLEGKEEVIRVLMERDKVISSKILELESVIAERDGQIHILNEVIEQYKDGIVPDITFEEALRLIINKIRNIITGNG